MNFKTVASKKGESAISEQDDDNGHVVKRQTIQRKENNIFKRRT